MSEAQLSHASENSVSLIDSALFTEVVDTSDMTVQEQVIYVKNLALNYIKGYSIA